MRKVAVYYGDIYAGLLTELTRGSYEFAYDKDYLADKSLHAKAPRAIDGRNPFAKDSLPWAAWIIARI